MMMWIFSFLVFSITLICFLCCIWGCSGANMDSDLSELSDSGFCSELSESEMTMQSDEPPGVLMQETSV